MFKNKDERKRQKELKQLEMIAEAFLKARSVYPPDYEGFLLIAGEKQVMQFYSTMLIVDTKARALGYEFCWRCNENGEWRYSFTPVDAAASRMEAAHGFLP